ncbi:MAG: LON peptidase substrate-binding domain-containing protein [Burkholderiales bacterium]|nr:LON peptidase substrate-binding domain-containing protein [Burkholderiales bacterium]
MFSFLTRKAAPSQPTTLALFPLAATLFPGGRLALKVFEQRYLELAKQRVADGERFGVVTLTAGGEVGAEQRFANVGTAVRVASYDVPSPGLFQLDVVAEDRFEILSTQVEPNGLHQAEIRWLPAEPRLPLPSAYADLGRMLEQVIARNGRDKFADPIALDDASWVGARWVEMLQVPATIKQSLLEINDAELRLKTVRQILQRMGSATG